MVIFVNAKINIGLNIIGKRSDGYHDLETIFYPVAVKDVLEIISSNNESYQDIIFTSSGNDVNVTDVNNLCVKAFHLVKNDFPQLPDVKIHLHKHIPIGAGMGGGSADASAVLLLLNKQFDLAISENKLMEYALKLGSDCPFFIMNKPSFAAGRGEKLEGVNIDLSGYKILIVHPGIHVNTTESFKDLSPNNFSAAGELQQNIQTDIYAWKTFIKNGFELSVFKQFPEIAAIKSKLYEAGAIYSSMSGSGSAVFGIFSEDSTTENIKFPPHYFCQLV
jgi:4-diphosphocytidyl-2-C-methyl-D-erythritol kinase